MASSPPPATVSGLYAEGVDAVVAVTAALPAAGWGAAVCGSWSAVETARHLVVVAEWYHLWLDRALNGELTRPFPAEDLDARNTVALSERRDLDGDDAIAIFAESAMAYRDRALLSWDLPFSFPFGTTTVGLHAGVAATEWHLHAWDLSALGDARHRPSRPGELLIAAGLGMASVEGGVKGAVTRRVVPIVARRSPWVTLLRRSGRG